MKKRNIILYIILSASLLISIGINIYQAFWNWDSYLQNTDEIYIMEAGILYNNLEFTDGKNIEITYDFSNDDYAVLKEKYNVEKIAEDGSEFEKALLLMNEFAPRLTHKSDYDNHIEISALPLLEYSLNKKSNGINCRAKAQILNEMCLSLGIYSRKVWIMPNSCYDRDCHVVNEVWDTSLNKWIMLDITNNEYWIDENGEPLSILEIRTKGANQEFCTPVVVGEKIKDIQKLKEKHMGDFLYIMKNMVYMEYCDNYTIGESETKYLLFPENLNTDYEYIISESSIIKSPVD
ncbi:MAG: transglutaminase-like domain-containing protein [Oscillospiraceae bacterium]|nr:transglutaminase-like domain-containing protein [Oscillospiraceae bacterium]